MYKTKMISVILVLAVLIPFLLNVMVLADMQQPSYQEEEMTEAGNGQTEATAGNNENEDSNDENSIDDPEQENNDSDYTEEIDETKDENQENTEEDVNPEDTDEIEAEEELPEAEEEEEEEEEPDILPVLFQLDMDNVKVSDLGDITHYNGITFQDFIAYRADTEGAMAVGGKAYIAVENGYGFDFGGAIEKSSNPYGYIGEYINNGGHPTLLLANAPSVGKTTGGSSVNSTSKVLGGPVVIKESVIDEYYDNTVQFSFDEHSYLAVAEDVLVDAFFANAKTQAQRVVSVLNQGGGSDILAQDFNMNWQGSGGSADGKLYYYTKDQRDAFLATGLKNTGSLNILVFNITDGGDVTIQGPYLSSDYGDYDFLIFNYPNANTATFSYQGVYIDGTQLDPSYGGITQSFQIENIPKYADKIIWNFPKATKVNVTQCGVIGSVLAPYASVFGFGGSINGMLIANSFETQGGMELHAFALNKNVFNFTNEENGGKEDKGKITLLKTDADDPETTLNGAEFKLYKNENEKKLYYVLDNEAVKWVEGEANATVLITSNGGRIEIDNLPYDTYYFQEVKAPEGYEADDSNKSVQLNGSTKTITITNKKVLTGGITVVKEDTNDSRIKLEGALFILYYTEDNKTYYYSLDDGTLVWTELRANAKVFATDEDGGFTVTGLPYGNYYLEETQAPISYKLPDKPFAVEVARQDAVTKYIANEKETLTGGIQLVKIDAQNNEQKLEAEFLLYYYEGDTKYYYQAGETTTFTTTKSEATVIATGQKAYEITGLPYGTYYLEEKTPPIGYIALDQDVEVVIDTVVPLLKMVENDPESDDPVGRLEIIKKDERETKELAGAEFVLYFYEGEDKHYYAIKEGAVYFTENMDEATRLITGENGRVLTENLPYGTYYLKEITPPNGYLILENDISLTLEQSKLEKVIQNKPDDREVTPEPDPLASIEVLKTDTNKRPLKGAEFVLYTVKDGEKVYYRNGFDSGNTKETATRFTSDAKGIFRIENLPYGTYYLEEVKSPAGYMKLKEAVQVKGEAAITYIEIVNEKEKENTTTTDKNNSGGKSRPLNPKPKDPEPEAPKPSDPQRPTEELPDKPAVTAPPVVNLVPDSGGTVNPMPDLGYENNLSAMEGADGAKENQTIFGSNKFNPKTGDTARRLWMKIAFIAFVGIGVHLYFRKRKRSR